MKIRLITFSLAVILMGAGLTTFPTASHACKCVEEKSVEKELESSNAVFSGKVIEIKTSNNKKYYLRLKKRGKAYHKQKSYWKMKGPAVLPIFLRANLTWCMPMNSRVN